MRILVVGAGGVGGYFGARLAADGNEVIFAVRGRQREAMAADGLYVRSQLGDLHVGKPVLLEHPAEAGLVNAALLCTKLWDLEAAAELARSLLAHDTAVIPLQNGVDSEVTVARCLGPQHVAGGVAHIAAQIETPGVIRHTGRMARLTFGELDASDEWRLEMLQAACQSAGIDSRVSRNIRGAIWEKFVLLSAFSGATAFYRCPIGEVLGDPARKAFLEQLLCESLAVGRAEGVDLALDLDEVIATRIAQLPPEMKSSMLVDLEQGNRLELDWLSGAVVRMAEEKALAADAHTRVVNELGFFKAGRTG